MLSVDRVVHLSASDLVGHLNCRYLTKLDLAVTKGKLEKPSVWDPVLELLVERGALHEQSYLDHLELNGLPILRRIFAITGQFEPRRFPGLNRQNFAADDQGADRGASDLQCQLSTRTTTR
jgi:hypothetical protein